MNEEMLDKGRNCLSFGDERKELAIVSFFFGRVIVLLGIEMRHHTVIKPSSFSSSKTNLATILFSFQQLDSAITLLPSVARTGFFFFRFCNIFHIVQKNYAQILSIIFKKCTNQRNKIIYLNTLLIRRTYDT